MFTIVFAIHLLICLGIIALVLLQQGKGAEAGALFGSNSDSVLGAGSAPNFIGRLTTGLAIGFMVTSILLVKVYMNNGQVGMSAEEVMKGSVLNVQTPEGEDTTSEKKPAMEKAVNPEVVGAEDPSEVKKEAKEAVEQVTVEGTEIPTPKE